jgi:hypothetical protein
MNSGKTDLCEVRQIKDRYSVTWNKHITGLSVYSEKAIILLDMIIRDSKSWEVGIQLSSGYVLWMSCTLLNTLDTALLTEYVQHAGNVKHPDKIVGAVFDNMDDVEIFIKRLEQKYIWHVLKQ